MRRGEIRLWLAAGGGSAAVHLALLLALTALVPAPAPKPTATEITLDAAPVHEALAASAEMPAVLPQDVAEPPALKPVEATSPEPARQAPAPVARRPEEAARLSAISSDRATEAARLEGRRRAPLAPKAPPPEETKHLPADPIQPVGPLAASAPVTPPAVIGRPVASVAARADPETPVSPLRERILDAGPEQVIAATAQSVPKRHDSKTAISVLAPETVRPALPVAATHVPPAQAAAPPAGAASGPVLETLRPALPGEIRPAASLSASPEATAVNAFEPGLAVRPVRSPTIAAAARPMPLTAPRSAHTVAPADGAAPLAGVAPSSPSTMRPAAPEIASPLDASPATIAASRVSSVIAARAQGASQEPAAHSRIHERIAVLRPTETPQRRTPERISPTVADPQTVIRFIADYHGGDCFAALPARLGEDEVAVTALAASRVRLADFSDRLARLAPDRTSLTAGLVSAAQCRALAFLAGARGYPDYQLRLQLDRPGARSGETLSGEVRAIGLNELTLLLVDDEGLVQSIAGFVRRKGEAASFAVPVTLTGAKAVTTAQLIVAIAANGRLATLERADGVSVGRFFEQLAAELETSGLSAEFAVAAFTLE